MGSKLYERFFQVVQRWPVDKSARRDLGGRLRKLVVEDYFPQGPLSKVHDEPKLTAELDSWSRLSQNSILQRYPRRFNNVSATGLDLEQLKAILSAEGEEET